MLRTIAPSGHLYTFDFHALRVETATDEFRRHGLADLVTVMHRDVCKEGFGLDTIADAVFLDLPSPWEALPFAKDVLMPGLCLYLKLLACIEFENLSSRYFNQMRSQYIKRIGSSENVGRMRLWLKNMAVHLLCFPCL